MGGTFPQLPLGGYLYETRKEIRRGCKAVDRTNLYDPAEAISLVKKTAVAKFDETIEAHIRTGCDGRHAEQQIRGAVVLPHGTGKTVRVLVFAKNAKADEALAAGADFVGAEDLIPKIQNEGWLDFDVVVATPDMMGVVGRLGRVLGPKGLMPNPKAGTVTMDVTKAVQDIKAGKIEYRLDKTNIIHVPIGKASVRWTGKLRPTVTGQYTLSFTSDDGCRLSIDGKMLIDAWTGHAVRTDTATIYLEAGKDYQLKAEYYDNRDYAIAKLQWLVPQVGKVTRLDLYGEAGKAVRECETVVAVLGINKSIEREGQDRYDIQLPADQQEFLQEIYKVNPNIVVVLVAGSSSRLL